MDLRKACSTKNMTKIAIYWGSYHRHIFVFLTSLLIFVTHLEVLLFMDSYYLVCIFKYRTSTRIFSLKILFYFWVRYLVVLPTSESSAAAARARKQEQHQQQPQSVDAVQSSDCVFMMRVSVVLLFSLLTSNLQFNFCLALILIHPYLKST